MPLQYAGSCSFVTGSVFIRSSRPEPSALAADSACFSPGPD